MKAALFSTRALQLHNVLIDDVTGKVKMACNNPFIQAEGCSWNRAPEGIVNATDDKVDNTWEG